ncbi:MAG: hypothetical protein AAF404_12040, partial [Pseudomonadota bacterium]
APDSSASYDLTVFNVVTSGSVSDTGTTSYMFSVVDASGAPVPTDNLSVALEIAASGSFTDAYRSSLFDLREAEGQAATFTARSAPVDLPSGSYQARLVVNPSWRHNFDIAPADHSHATSYHFVAERDYRNNASEGFQLQVSSATQCVEDGFENNDNHQSAQPIPAGGQINASLCEDHMDLYSVRLAAGESATIAFHYDDPAANLNNSTRYTVLDASLTPTGVSRAAKDSHSIDIAATGAGTYYLALHGARSSYRLNRFSGAAGPDLADDFVDSSLFAYGSELSGPQSWLLGQITLQKLAITAEKMLNQTVNCGRITTQYDNDQPVAYVTPNHFADIHEFQFLDGGQYVVDGEVQSSWSIANDDIINAHWYGNEYPGYAERVSDDRWRYWTADGLAYVECAIDL